MLYIIKKIIMTKKQFVVVMLLMFLVLIAKTVPRLMRERDHNQIEKV